MAIWHVEQIFVPLAYSVKADNDEDDERLREKVNQERSTESKLFLL